MSTVATPPRETHQVINQPPVLEDYNLFDVDRPLQEALEREGTGWAREQVRDFAAQAGSAEVIRWGFQANENPPQLHTHDRFGRRRDEVEFHPAWHNLMRLAIAHGIHNLPLNHPRPGAHVARAALMYLDGQNEAGHSCPISMTYSVAPALEPRGHLWREWEGLLRSTEYDPQFAPASRKKGVLFGMAMTEKQGGSDVRANTTRAERIGGDEYLLTGHKWFVSAPMCDAFLTLAQAGGGLSCFLLPRWTPDGEPNRFLIQRLKDKMGNRSNASSEVELDGAWARLVGEEGRGVATIMEMVVHTRLDCTIGSCGLMRQALTQALHHARYRSAFGRALLEQPLMRNVLADLAIESEAGTALMMRAARAFDCRKREAREQALARLAVAAAKYWITKRTPPFVAEALECLGGNGYVEESWMPRLFRESPLNSVWEGCGNVNSLDILRAMKKDPESLDAVLAEIRLARGADARLDAFVRELENNLAPDEPQARRLAERLCLALQGALLVRYSSAAVADAFCATRLASLGGATFGTLPASADLAAILERA